MNKKIAIALLASIVLLFTSCEDLVEALILGSPTGYVYDTKVQDAVISDATVTLTSTSGSKSYSTSTNSSGQYTFDSDVEYGEYELTAEKTGYIFIKQIVIVSQNGSTLPNIGGFSNAGINEGVISIVTFWDRDFKDVDAHLTFPSTAVGYATFNTGDSNYDYYNPTGGTYSQGFFPNTTVNRTRVYYDNKTFLNPYDNTETAISLDVDNTGASSQAKGGPETITISKPHAYDDYNSTYAFTSTGTSHSSKLPAGSYVCVGVMEFYLDAYNTSTSDFNLTTSNNTSDASPRVFLFNGSEQIGLFELPTYTDAKRVSVFRINSFNTSSEAVWYQIIPEIKLVSEFRGINDSFEPIIIKGASGK